MKLLQVAGGEGANYSMVHTSSDQDDSNVGKEPRLLDKAGAQNLGSWRPGSQA